MCTWSGRICSLGKAGIRLSLLVKPLSSPWRGLFKRRSPYLSCLRKGAGALTGRKRRCHCCGRWRGLEAESSGGILRRVTRKCFCLRLFEQQPSLLCALLVCARMTWYCFSLHVTEERHIRLSAFSVCAVRVTIQIFFILRLIEQGRQIRSVRPSSTPPFPTRSSVRCSQIPPMVRWPRLLHRYTPRRTSLLCKKRIFLPPFTSRK